MTNSLANWAGHITFGAHTQHQPRSVAELQEIVRRADKVHAHGSRHSFNDLADSLGHHLSLRSLPRRIEIDAAGRTVTIDGGITYSELCPALDAAGLALPNLASNPEFTVVGAAATATHGSGNDNRNLAAPFCALEFVTASGEIVTIKRGDPDFAGAAVHIGALGIVSAATLDLVPRFDARQNIFLDLPFEELASDPVGLMGSAFSISLFSHWRGDIVDQVWVKSLATAPSPGAIFRGARAADTYIHPIIGAFKDEGGGTPQMGVSGTWYERVPHAMIGAMPSSGAELQAEYFVDLSDAGEALRAVHRIAPRFADLLMVSEIRTVAADDFWLSMNYERPSLAIHFAFERDWPAVSRVLPVVEAALAPFKPRPHWGKTFTMPGATIQAAYPRLNDFRALAQRLDPAGKFRNSYLDEIVF